MEREGKKEKEKERKTSRRCLTNIRTDKNGRSF
jgi:hypothetical protein